MIIIRWIKEKIRKFKEDRAFKKKLKEIKNVIRLHIKIFNDEAGLDKLVFS